MQRIKIFEHAQGEAGAPALGIEERYNKTSPEFQELYGKRGVYFIYKGEASKKPIYIGRSISDIGKTIMRHFQNWAKAKERKYTEYEKPTLLNLWVEVKEMPDASDESIFVEEGEQIEKYKPRNNMIKAVKKWKDNAQQYEQKYNDIKAQWDEYLTKKAEEEQAAKEALEKADAEEAEAQRLKAIADAEELQALQAKQAAEQAEQEARQAEQNAKNAQRKAEERARKMAGVQGTEEFLKPSF